MRAILVGATGLIGGLLLENLLQDPIFTQIKLISRRSTGIKNKRLEEVLVDFENEEQFKNALTPAEVLFCCIGTTQQKVKGDKLAYRKIDFDIPVKAAAWCAAQGIAKFLLVSAVGANTASRNFYLKLKGETEAGVMQQSFKALYIMRPAQLLGKRKETRVLESAFQPIMRLISHLLPDCLSKYKAIDAKQVAAAMQGAAKKTVDGVFICHYKEMRALASETCNIH
ncbi:MAG: NAD(P)H-binding protein [Bacteroidota bacterium]